MLLVLGVSVTAASQRAAAPRGRGTPAPAPFAACPAPPSEFGSKDRLRVGLEGKIYFIDKTTRKIPDFSTMQSQGSVYAARWDVPPRAFTQGFPGVTDRFEYFAIDYRGTIYVPREGTYAFVLGSDDGSMLYIDETLVVNSDGMHAYRYAKGSATLTEGDHEFRLSYMQGPRTTIALQLWVVPPGEKQKIFTLQDFSRAVLDSRKSLEVVEDDKEIQLKLGSEILFDTGRYDVKPAATRTLQALASLLESYPGFPIVIEGHTDNVGRAEPNQVLSENRARAVGQWLTSNGHVPAACIHIEGFGLTMPVATNDTAEGRQQNRRVAIRLQKPQPPQRGRR
jgi:outer membrane protein OmpA-like peptidoglycan-associated protein